MAQAERAFDRPSGKRRKEEAEARKIAHLEAKLANKNDVIAERAPPRVAVVDRSTCS
jgi:hypothetical protein